MALVGEELASVAMLDKVMCVCPGRRPIETCTEGLAYKGLSRGMVTTEIYTLSLHDALPIWSDHIKPLDRKRPSDGDCL